MNVAEWLRGLGLEQYAPAFRDNHVDGEVLRRLTAEDLRELGVASIGHRRRLLDAIAALVAADTPPISTPAPIAVTEAERRQLTVMFCDLVGSTPLSARLDPEDLRGIIGAYHRCVTEIVEGFGGFVARYMGDGILAYFGCPQAHEDDGERATRCGLALVDRVPQLDRAEELHGQPATDQKYDLAGKARYRFESASLQRRVGPTSNRLDGAPLGIGRHLVAAQQAHNLQLSYALRVSVFSGGSGRRGRPMRSAATINRILRAREPDREPRPVRRQGLRCQFCGPHFDHRKELLEHLEDEVRRQREPAQ